jgi:hypothetical protein
MKKNGKKVLAFPAPPPEPAVTTVTVQIGSERFAIHFEIEDLPPAAPTPPKLVLLRKPAKKRQPIR